MMGSDHGRISEMAVRIIKYSLVMLPVIDVNDGI